MILEIVMDTIETCVKRKKYFQVGFLRLLVLINWLRTSCFPCGIISSKNYTIAAGKCMTKLKKDLFERTVDVNLLSTLSNFCSVFIVQFV